MFLLSGHNTMKNAKFKVKEPEPARRNLVEINRRKAIDAAIGKVGVVEVRVPNTPIHRIIDLVARMHGVTYVSLMSRSRSKQNVTARSAAMCAVKELRRTSRNPLSLHQTGLMFGRDHTTVLHALQRRGYR